MQLEPMSLHDEKSQVRKAFRAVRAGFARESGSAAVPALQEHIRRWLREATVGDEQICAYRPRGDEADPCVKPFKELYFPKIEGERIRFFKPAANDAFVANTLGILEPKTEGAIPLDAERPVLLLCPAVAVESLGRRVGQGAGHYDRFFQAHPQALRVGVVFHVQVSQNPLPLEGWDQPLDWIITEKMILRVSQRSS